MMNAIPCPYGSVGPRALVSLPTSTTASEEQGDGAGGVYVFVAVGADVSIAFGPAGAVSTPTPAVGYQVRVGDAHVAMRLPSGTRFRAVSASAGTLVWYRSQLFDARDLTATFYGLPWHTLIVPSAGVTLDGGAVSQIDDLSGNGNHFTQATAARRPTIVTGAHGKPVLLFDGVDDCLKSAATLTCPTNYIVWTSFRLTSLPSETSGLRQHVWSMSSGGGTANVESLDINGSDFLEAEVANTNEQATGYAMGKTAQTVASVATYPSAEIRVNNAAVATIGPGTRIPPVQGSVVIGSTAGETVGRFAYMELSAFGILDADELGADLEATLATLQAYAELQWGV